jgi:hypothetical protein
MSMSNNEKYEVKWNGPVCYITGPGVDVLRLDVGDYVDTGAIADALAGAFAAGRASTAAEPYQGAGEPRHCAHEPAGFGHCGHLGCPNSMSLCMVHGTPSGLPTP